MSGDRSNQRGRPRLISRGVLEGYRRERIYLAVVELAHEGGPETLTTSGIVKRGRMSRNTFYELFADKAECLDLACRWATDRLTTSIRTALPESGTWRERLDGTVAALLGAVAAEPELAELCLVHAPAVATHGTELGAEPVIEVLVEAMGKAKAEAMDGNRPPTPGVEEFVAATIVSIVVSRVRRGDAAELPALEDGLTDLAARLWTEPAERVGAP